MSLVGEKIRRSILYGSLATPIKKPDSDHTHKWTVYVRGFNGEDISYYVKRSRAHCVDVDQHPFEVNETGWGEFQIQIKIIFQDPSQRPLTINHHLRLYPPDDAGQLKTSKPVLSEFYDEIIFDPATESMTKLLQEHNDLSAKENGSRYQELLNEESKEIERIDKVISVVRTQLEEVGK